MGLMDLLQYSNQRTPKQRGSGVIVLIGLHEKHLPLGAMGVHVSTFACVFTYPQEARPAGTRA